MNRTVVLSTDNNPNYFFYAPIVAWAWKKFGWDVALFVTEDCDLALFDMREALDSNVDVWAIPPIPNVRTGTLAQVVRHFASNVLPKDSYIMVQDIDLIPLKPWEPDMNVATIYGWDTTGRGFIPVHYTGMTGQKWYDLMDCTGDLAYDMEREMVANGRAYAEKWEDFWDADWDILTKKVLAKKDQFNFIDRGMVQLGKYETPKGRIDRCSIEVKDGVYHWGYTANQDALDMHCENHNPSAPEKWRMIRETLVQYFGELPEWMDSYVEQFHKQYGV